MACFGPDAPEPRNYGQETAETLVWQMALAPSVYATEAKLKPKYADLALKTLGQFMRGSDKQPGFIKLYQEMAPELAAAQNAATDTQREGDIAAVERLGQRATEAILGASPYQKALLERLNARAQQDLDLGSALDPVTMRQIRNSVMGERSARGWGLSPADMAAVGLSTGAAGQALRQSRQQGALQVLGANQAVLGDPFLAILGRQSGVTAQIPGLLGQGQVGGQNLGPTMFNPESGYASNLNAQNAAQQWQYNLSNPSTFAKIAGVNELAGDFLGTLGSAFTLGKKIKI